MKKTVTIQEAIKANEHSRVRILNCSWYEVGELFHSETKLGSVDILADWEIEEKPLEVWCNVYSNGVLDLFKTRVEADIDATEKRIRCVKMREVLENE